MNNNYIIYNDIGLLEKQSVNPVSMGNNYTDLFYFAFKNKSFRECYLTFTATLPDGTNMPSAATTPTTFEYEGVEYDGYLMRLSNAYTQIAGTLTFTLRLKENKTNMVLCSTQLTLEIHDSDVVTPTSITESEKDQILQAIADGNRELHEKKVDKDFTPYVKLEHAELGANDTLVVNHNNEIYKIEAKDFYNEVNGKTPDENGVININSNDIPYKDTEKSVSDELDDKLSKKDNIVRYKREYEENMPDIIVNKANMAIKDQKGNIIDETYINNEFLQQELNKNAKEYPIGSCLLFEESINPNNFLNGTWENVENILSTINVWKRIN